MFKFFEGFTGRGRMKDVKHIECDIYASIEYKNGDKEQIKIQQGESGERYIKMEGGNKKYDLIETEEEAVRKIKEGSDLSNTIFCTKVSLRHTTFKDMATFQESVFLKTVHLENITFEKGVNFSFTIFHKDLRVTGRINQPSTILQESVNFSMAEFRDKALFLNGSIKYADFNFTEFLKDVSFVGVSVNDSISFLSSKFRGEVLFSVTKCKKMHFGLATFEKKLTFLGDDVKSFFAKNISLKSAKIQNLVFRGIHVSGYLDLKNSIADTIDCSEIQVDGAENRETFRILKNAAIQQNDRVSALEFHKREYKKYAEELKSEKGKWQDRFILYFENIASEHGTNCVIPIFWIAMIVFLPEIYHFIYDLTNNWELISANIWARLDLVLFNALSVKPNIMDAFKSSHGSGISLLLNVIRGILLSVFLYEAIKSFRKYSRRL